VPWRFGVAALQRLHGGVSRASAMGRESVGGSGLAAAFSGAHVHAPTAAPGAAPKWRASCRGVFGAAAVRRHGGVVGAGAVRRACCGVDEAAAGGVGEGESQRQ
jgi:hypothetical protein